MTCAMSPSTSAAGRIQILAAACLFSTGGAAIKAIELGGWPIAGFRSGIAAAVLLLLVPAARQGWSWRVLPVGAAYAATLVLFVLANRLTTAANAIFLQATAPLYILLLGPLLLREPVRRSDLVFMALVGTGLALFFVGSEMPAATAPDPAAGNLLAAASGLTWALTVIGLRWIGRAGSGMVSPIAPVVAGNAMAFLACLPMALPMPLGRPLDWILIAYLGVFQIGLAYLLLTTAIRHVSALEATLLLLLEPALSPAWAWLVHREEPSAWALAGGALIVTATLVRTWRTSRTGATRVVTGLPPPRP